MATACLREPSILPATANIRAALAKHLREASRLRRILRVAICRDRDELADLAAPVPPRKSRRAEGGAK